MKLDLDDTTRAVIGVGIEIYPELGPGFLGSVYESARVVEVEHRRVPFVRLYGVQSCAATSCDPTSGQPGASTASCSTSRSTRWSSSAS